MRLILIAVLYGTGEAISRGLQFFSILWVASITTKDKYGEFGLLFALQQFVTLLALGGFSEALFGRLSNYRDRNGRQNLFLVVIRLFLGVSLFVILGIIGGLFVVRGMFSPSIPSQLLVVVPLVGFLLAYFQLRASISQVQEQHILGMIFRFCPSVLCYFPGLLGAKNCPDPVVGFYTSACGGLVLLGVATLLIPKVRWRTLEACDVPNRRTILIESIPYGIVSLFGWLSSYGNNFIVKVFLSNVDVADYTMSCTVASSLLLIMNAVSQVWNPVFFRKAAEGAVRLNEAHAFVHKLQLFSLSVAAGVILMFFSDALTASGGNLASYRNAMPFVTILLLTYIISALYNRGLSYFLVNREGPLFCRIVAGISILGFAVSLLLIWRIGAYGAYLGVLVVVILRAGMVYWIARQRWGALLHFEEVPLALLTVGVAIAVTFGISALPTRAVVYAACVFLIAAAMFFRERASLREYIGGASRR